MSVDPKTCQYRTYQNNKCVHEKNKDSMKVGSCTKVLCPLEEVKVEEQPRQSKFEKVIPNNSGQSNRQRDYRG